MLYCASRAKKSRLRTLQNRYGVSCAGNEVKRMFNSESIVFVVYLVFMLGIGIYFFIRDRNGGEKTYFLGGR